LQTYDVNYLNMAKTYLKVLKDNCCRLMSLYSLEAFACLEVSPLGHDGSILLSVVTQAFLLTVVGMFLSLPLLVMLLMAVSWNSRFLRAGFCTGAHRRLRVAEGGLHL
jgi:hypothetical protein